MSRAGFILLLLVFGAGSRAAFAQGGFGTPLAADVFATALAFMAPRTLDPVAIPQLAVWGLRGISAIDPQLTPDLRDNSLRLAAPDRILIARPAPAADDPDGWGGAVAELAAAAYGWSPAIRRAGTEGVIRSFFDELFNHLDPYSRYTPPREAEADRARRSGLAGAGVQLAARGAAIVVAEVIAGSPAEQAGVRVGEQIVSVDGRATARRGVAEVADWIAGPEGTQLSLAVRGRDGRTRSVDLVRALVPPETVFADHAGAMLVLRVTGFSRSTGEHLARALVAGLADAPADAKRRPAAGVVLDLRGNRGGLLRQAIAAADSLLPPGLVAITAGRDPQAAHEFVSPGQDLASGTPVVVVVDGRTASAAEVLAAALADRGRAVVVGSATLGKGLVQTIAALPDGGELLVTWSRVLAPRGWPIQGLGVLPQICTSLGQDALTRQLAAAAQGSLTMGPAVARARRARAPVAVADMLDIRNACPAAEGRDADLDAARYLIEHPEAYATALLPPLRGP